LELLNTLSAQFSSNEYRLLIIDSIMACFRVDYCGRGELADRQQKLNQFLSKLTHMAEEFNVCVLMVCQSDRLTRRLANKVLPSRPTKSKAILVPAPSSPVLTAASQSVATSSRTPRQRGYCSVKGGAMSG